MMDERDLVRLAQQLGVDADHRIDPARVSARVLARLRARPVGRPWWRQAKLLPLAAAAAAVLAVGVGIVELTRRSPQDVADVVPVHLYELAVTELDEVLDSLQVDVPVAELVSAGLHDLDENELTQLLESMEG